MNEMETIEGGIVCSQVIVETSKAINDEVFPAAQGGQGGKTAKELVGRSETENELKNGERI